MQDFHNSNPTFKYENVLLITLQYIESVCKSENQLSHRGENAFAEQSIDDGALAVTRPAEEDDLHVVTAQHAGNTLNLLAKSLHLLIISKKKTGIVLRKELKNCS